MRVRIKATSYQTKAGEMLAPFTSVDLPLEEAREVLSAGVADAEAWDGNFDDGGPEKDTDGEGLPKGDTLTGGPDRVPPDGFLASGEPGDRYDPMTDGKYVSDSPAGNTDGSTAAESKEAEFEKGDEHGDDRKGDVEPLKQPLFDENLDEPLKKPLFDDNV